MLRTRISHKPIASETITDGRRIWRIFGKQIYGELEIPPIRHRRETSLEVTRRRLLSLDFVLDHPELTWLPTEREKLACFQQLGIEPWMLPRRIYAGHAKGRVQYFPLRVPVAMGPEAALFVYIDPGMETRTELDSWREAHRPLWQMLRELGWRIEVVAVAWEQELLDRAERVMRSWVGRNLTEAGRELLTLRWAVSSADRETVERYGGLNAALKKINQLKQAMPEPQGRGLIDDFRLRGSRTWRRMGGHLSDGGWLTQVAHQVAHAFDHSSAPLSEGGAFSVVVQVVRGNPHWMSDWHGFPESSAVKRSAAPAPRVPASHGASWRRTGGGGSGGSDPLLLTAGAAPGRVRWCMAKFTTSPPLRGSLPPQ